MRNNMFKKGFVFGIIVLFFGAGALPSIGGKNAEVPTLAAAIDLSDLILYYFDFEGYQPRGDWILENQNTIARQTINCDPCFLLHPTQSTQWTVDCTFRVGHISDDDIIGFTFGYQDESHFCIMDWKQEYEDWPEYGIGQEGFSIKKISVPSPLDLSVRDFWQSNGTAYSNILASNFGEGKGWDDSIWYDFHLNFSKGIFTIRVENDSDVLWEVIVDDGEYKKGQFGFYANSQIWAQFTAISIKAKAKDPYDDEGPYGELTVTMPRNKALNFNFNLLEWLFERFPNLFPILQILLQRLGLQ